MILVMLQVTNTLFLGWRWPIFHWIFRNILSGCTQIHADEDKRKRFAWHLSDCFQKDSGRRRFPNLSKQSEAVYKQSEDIVRSQSELRNEAVEIENQIDKVGESMTSRFQNLQSKADDIENMAGSSLSKQQELLDGQSTALKGLESLTESQSAALQESRNAMQHLADLGRQQQEELLERQKQLQQVHDHLVSNSKSILEAQEAFEVKQASMFIALDKLFELHNAMLLESRGIKAFFIYTMSIFIIYMVTSTKQTYPARAILYLGLSTTFLLELAIIRLTPIDLERQTWMINLARLLFAFLAILKIIHAIYTYRDYEVLNHRNILTLTEKINSMQRSREMSDSDSEVEWSRWVDDEISEEEVTSLRDPDYMIPGAAADRSIVSFPVTSNYNLRQRHHFS